MYNDKVFTDEELIKIFIDREPYNSLNERIVDFSKCGAVPLNSLEYQLINVYPETSQENIQQLISNITRPFLRRKEI